MRGRGGISVGVSGVGGTTGSGGTGATQNSGRVDVTLKLSQLQNFCKRDPEGYRDDYDAQVRRLESECGILTLSPSSDPSPRLVELIQFCAAVSSSSYKGKESDRISTLLIDLLLGHYNPTNKNNKKDDNPAAQEQTHAVEKGGRGKKKNKNKNKDKDSGNKNVSVANVIHMSSWSMQLHRDVRKACVSALILMRNKGTVEPIRLLELFFRLMSVVPDKALRETLHRHIVNDIRNINKKGKRDDKVNRSIQSFLHRVISTHGQFDNNNTNSVNDHPSDIATKHATDMVCELYRRNVWTGDRVVAILTSAVTANNTTVMCKAIRFFLNIEEKMAEDKRIKEEEGLSATKHIDFHSFSKKTKSRVNHVLRQIKKRDKYRSDLLHKNDNDWLSASPDEHDKSVEACRKLYPAIELIRDPQGLAEAVFKRLRVRAKANKYEIKLLMINFITRLVGNHELLVLQLYPYLQKYMGGHQRDVTQILAYSIQACHEQVPPEEVYGILKTIAHNFITERCSEEQIAVGINAARAICARVPSTLSIEESSESKGASVMDIEAFAQDLAGFGNHRDRSVSISGKAWTNFVRETYPALLSGKKQRGMLGSALARAGTKPLRYGENRVSSGVEGADLLVEYEAKKKHLKEQQHQNFLLEQQEEEGSDVDENDDSDNSSAAPDLVVLDEDEKNSTQSKGNSTKEEAEDEKEKVIDVSKMSVKEREKLRMAVSSERIFTVSEFSKMKKLVEREQRLKRDPREAARQKRRAAKMLRDAKLSLKKQQRNGARGGDEDKKMSNPEEDNNEEENEMQDDQEKEEEDNNEVEESSSDDDSFSDSDDEYIRIKGVVNPGDIMAEAARKRKSKAEKLEKIIGGRISFETKARAGGSTNEEKKRNKNFIMTKSAHSTKAKGRGKSYNGGNKRNQGNDRNDRKQNIHERKKRRRKA